MLSKAVRLLVFCAFPACLLFSSPLLCQVNDAGLWTSVSFEARVVKKLTASISEEIRFNENITEVGVIFTDVGMEYKLNKHFQVAFDYRYIKKRMVDDFYITRHRLHTDIKYERKIKPIQFQVRTRLSNYTESSRVSDGGNPSYYLRNKLSVKWDLDKAYKPYISAELFSPLSYPRYSAFDNIRTTAGIEYNFTKHHKIDAYYMIQKEFNVSNPEADFVFGLGYFYKL